MSPDEETATEDACDNEDVDEDDDGEAEVGGDEHELRPNVIWSSLSVREEVDDDVDEVDDDDIIEISI